LQNHQQNLPFLVFCLITFLSFFTPTSQGANLGLMDALALARAIGAECSPHCVPAALQVYNQFNQKIDGILQTNFSELRAR
jgi:hypothetical protein